MISLISSWVKLILSVYIFITLIEIILPTNNIKKYAKFVLGLVVLITILIPILKFINRGINVEGSIDKYFKYYYSQDIDTNQNKYNQEIVKEFKSKLISRLEDELNRRLDNKYKISELVINEDLSKLSFGKIEKIVLKKELSGKIKPIEKVAIGNRENTIEYDNENKEVINFLKTNFEIDESAIKIEK